MLLANETSFLNRLYASDLTIGEADFDAVRVKRGFGENVSHDAARELPCALILLEHNRHFEAGMNVLTISTICHRFQLPSRSAGVTPLSPSQLGICDPDCALRMGKGDGG